MKKLVWLIGLIVLFSLEGVSAACTETTVAGEKDTGSCVISSGYLFEEKCSHENDDYRTELAAIYSKYATTSSKGYSSISCREMMALETPKTNNISILSGSGFDYSGIKVSNTFVCTGIFEYNLFNYDYKSANDVTKKAMMEELSLFQSWSDNINSTISKSIGNSLVVTIVDSNNEKYKEINALTELVDRSVTTVSQKSIAATVQGKNIKVWAKSIKVISTFDPVLKKTITSGQGYGDVILDKQSCISCTAADRKLYTDFEQGSGNQSLATVVKYQNKDWTIRSSCGYNIYNSGSVSWVGRLPYRTIDLDNPFPNGASGLWENWKSNKLITGNEYKNTPMYVVTLDTDTIKSIRQYNDNNKYNSELSSNGNYVNGKYHSDFVRGIFSKVITKAG